MSLQQPNQLSENDSSQTQEVVATPSIWRKVSRFIAKFILVLITLLLVLVLAVVGLLFTNTGLNMSLWAAQKALPQLQVGETQGALLSHFVVYDFSYVDPTLNLDTQIDKLELALDLECLMLPAVCVEKVGLAGVRFSMPELPASTETPEPTTSQPNQIFSSPIAANIKLLQLSDIELDILGNQIQFEGFTSSLAMVGEKLSIYPTLLHALHVSLAPSTSVPETPETDQTAQAQDIVLPEVWIPLTIDMTSFTLTNFQLAGESPIEINEALLSAYASQHRVEIREFNIDMPQLEGRLTAQADLLQDYPLQLDSTLLLKETDLAGQRVTLSTTGSIGNLSLESSLREVINLELSGSIEPLKPELPFNLTIENGVLQWPLTGESDFDVQVETLATEGSLEGYNLDLVASVQGSIMPDVALDVSGAGDLNQIALERIDIQTLGGQVLGSVMANWQQPINWGADVTLNNIQPGLQWEQAEGSISGDLSTTGYLTEQGGWVVDLPLLNIEGVLRDYPLNIEGSLDAQDLDGEGNIEIKTPNLSLAHGENKVSVKGELNEQWAIDTDIQLVDLAKSVPQLKGALIGTLGLTGALETPDLAIDIHASKLAWEEIAAIESTSLSGVLTPLPAPSGDLNLTVSNVIYEDQTIESAKISFKGSEEKHTLTFDIISELISGGVAITGGIEQQPNMLWNGSLTDAQFSTMQGTWRLDDDPQLSYSVDEQLAKVQAHCWLQAKSSVCLSKDLVAGPSGEVFVDINGFDFEQVSAFIPKETKLDGEVNLQSRVKWSPKHPIEAQVTLTLPKGQVTQTLERPLVVGWNSVEFVASLTQDTLTSKWQLDLTDNGSFEGYANINDVLDDNREIDGQIVLDALDLNFLEPFFGEFSRVNALIESDIRLIGPILKPKVDGYFHVGEIEAMGDITPVELKSGDIQLNFAGYEAKLDASVSTTEGQLQITGDADWNDLEQWQTNLAIFADELKVEVPPIVKVTVKPDIKVAIKPGLIKLDGNVDLPWGRILVSQLPESAVSVSSDEVILDENLQPVEASTGIPFDLESNIKINIGNDFRLAAFGLKGSLIGDLNVTQEKKGPFIIGEINIVDGSYRSFGQDLIIDEGKILFNGPADQPYVSIKAIRNPDNTEDDVVAGIQVTGPADEPEIAIFSDPAMPQANALSYILKGQDIDGESGGDAMTTVLIGISLARSGKVVGEIGEAFGVQDLQLDTAGSGDESQVTVSGYLLPGLQVKYGIGIFDSIGEFTLRYRIMKDLYLEAVSGSDNAVDFLYQIQFDWGEK